MNHCDSINNNLNFPLLTLGAIRLLGNAKGVGVFGSCYFSVTKVYGPTLLALRGGQRGVKFQEKT